MTAAQVVHEFMRDHRLLPAAEDVPWGATSTAWRNGIEAAVEYFADPECWALLEAQLETAQLAQQEAEERCHELETQIDQMKASAAQ